MLQCGTVGLPLAGAATLITMDYFLGKIGYKTASYNQQRSCIMYNFGTRLRGFGAMFNAHLQAV